MIYIAYVTKGLEEISKEELLSISGIKILSVEQKFIKFSYEGNIRALKELKTIDDVGVYVSDINTHQLTGLNLKNEREIIESLVPFISGFRDIDERFSITLSRYKNNEIVEEDIKLSLSKYITEVLNFNYQPFDHTNYDIKINVNQDSCMLSVKLFPESLYKRPYGHESRLGAIKSTIAGAMLYKLTEGKDRLRIIDTFCGTGTMLCEALLKGMDVYGGDIDLEAVAITQRNLGRVNNKDYDIKNEDASKTSWKDNYFDIAISNFPWNKQIKVNQLYKLIDNSIKEFSRILNLLHQLESFQQNLKW